jgi:hypothetical protein
MPTAAEKVRVQFDFSPESYEELNELQGEVNASTKAETVRYALRLLQWVVSETNAGRKILVEDDSNTQEVIFPFLTRRNGVKAKK